MRSIARWAALATIASLAVAGCGGSDAEPVPDGSAVDSNPNTDTLQPSAVADGSYQFAEESLTAVAGTITVTFENPAPIAHDFCVETSEAAQLGCTELTADGDTAIADFALEPGEYVYYCSVAGHREEGMEGTLTVSSPT